MSFIAFINNVLVLVKYVYVPYFSLLLRTVYFYYIARDLVT